jgi:hypothetical protein
VDTSVLLDLYRFSADARDGLLKALKSFGDRLWIPHQVGLEFHRNRFGVLLDQREAEGKLLNELDEIQKDLDAQLSQRLRGAGRRDLDPLRDAVNDGFKQLRDRLQEAEKAHTEGLGKSIQEDPIYEEVEGLCANRIGEQFSEEQMRAALDDAKKRFSEERPPGYLDAGKTDAARYGDVILWHQLCAMARVRKAPVVLVADDRKSDWVWEVRGKTLGPRPELVAEMFDTAGVGFHLYTPSRLFEIWKDRQGGDEERPEILEEIRSPYQSGPESPFQDLSRHRRHAGKAAVDAFNEGRRATEQISRLVASARSSLDFEEGEWVLSLQFVPFEIDGSTTGVRARVTDPLGLTSTVDFPGELSVAGRPRTVVLRYPRDFQDATLSASGEYAVEWIAFSQIRHLGAVVSEAREMLAHNTFAMLVESPNPDAPPDVMGV